MSPQPASQPVGSPIRPSTWARILAIRDVGTLAALILMLLVIAVFIPQFSRWGNIVNITPNFSFVGLCP